MGADLHCLGLVLLAMSKFVAFLLDLTSRYVPKHLSYEICAKYSTAQRQRRTRSLNSRANIATRTCYLPFRVIKPASQSLSTLGLG